MCSWKWKLLSCVRPFATPDRLRNSLGQNTGVGGLSLLQGIFPTQGLNPGLPHYGRWILYQLSHKRSPRILEWVVYPFSSGSSQPRKRTRVSCIEADSLPTELPGKLNVFNVFLFPYVFLLVIVFLEWFHIIFFCLWNGFKKKTWDYKLYRCMFLPDWLGRLFS